MLDSSRPAEAHKEQWGFCMKVTLPLLAKSRRTHGYEPAAWDVGFKGKHNCELLGFADSFGQGHELLVGSHRYDTG